MPFKQMHRHVRGLDLGLGLALLVLSCSGSDGSMQSPDGGAPPPMPAAPSAYTAKVKNLLTGQAPTDEELRTVTKDPKTLPNLIDKWMGQPEYYGKIVEFYKQAFQQTQVALQEFDDQLGVPTNPWPGVDKVRFLYGAEVSFPLTVLQLIAEDRPFTEVVTTDRFMLNPPLMAALALNDALVIDDNGKPQVDWIAQKFPTFRYVREKDTPIPFTDSIDPKSPNFMTFYDSMPYAGPNKNCDYPLTIPAKTPQGLYRAVQFLGTWIFGGRPGCGASASYFTDADWKAWRMVRIRAPRAGEDRTLFWDLPHLKDPNTTELVLNTPRVGFMSTMAFMANWPTNLSNLARVTTNQSLIVALGKSLADPKAAVPITESGNPDARHAQPGTACYNCHKVLDPMRDFLRQSFSVSYHAQTLTLPAEQQGAEFILDDLDIKGTGGGVRELAAAMIQSPRFATAWTQKLCQYANSSPCSEDDPEFLRVADAFKQSGYKFKTLLRELFSSPLVTQAAITKTAQDQGEVISVSRREHFCAALSNRLGIADACLLIPTKMSVIQNLAFGIPGSGYSRGSPSPLLPHDPDLFFVSAVENLCAQMADLVIDAKGCKTGQKCWSSKDSGTAIKDFVRTLMALEPSDPRSADISQILTDHFTEAGKTASASDALKSTFVLACASPLSDSSGL